MGRGNSREGGGGQDRPGAALRVPRHGPALARRSAARACLRTKPRALHEQTPPRAPGRAQAARRVPLGVLLWAHRALLLLKTRHAVRRPPRCTPSETRAMGRRDVCVRHTESACPAHW